VVVVAVAVDSPRLSHVEEEIAESSTQIVDWLQTIGVASAHVDATRAALAKEGICTLGHLRVLQPGDLDLFDLKIGPRRVVQSSLPQLYSSEKPKDDIPGLLHMEMVEKLVTLGRGAYGECCECLLSSPPGLAKGKYAVKFLHAKSCEPAIIEDLVQEARHTQELKHPNIIEVAGYVWDDSGRFGLVLEHCSGNLEMLVRRQLDAVKNGLGWFELRQIADIVQQLASALAFMHRQDPPVAHRDVACDNILFQRGSMDRVKRVMLGDLGLASQVDAVDVAEYDNVGKRGYLSPFPKSGAVSLLRADVFAAGRVLFALLTGQEPRSTSTRDFKVRLDRLPVSQYDEQVTLIELQPFVDLYNAMTADGPLTAEQVERELRSLAGHLVQERGGSEIVPQPPTVQKLAESQPALVHDDLRTWLEENNLLPVVSACPSLRTFRLETVLRRTDADLRRILGDNTFESADGQRLVAAVAAENPR
jgi:serine/threonine protein kinase